MTTRAEADPGSGVQASAAVPPRAVPPRAVPPGTVPAAGSFAGRGTSALRLRDVALPGVLVAPQTSVLELDRYFRGDPLLQCVVVGTGHDPVLIDRRWFQGWITGPLGYGRAVNQRYRLSALCPPASLVLAADCDLEQAAAAVIGAHAGALTDHVGVVWPDRRVGVVPVREIFRLLAGRYAFRALHDALTGLPNRAYLTERLAHLTDRREDLAVLYVDLDRFKDVNDRFGHAAGDQVLVTFARRLREAVRTQDLVVRLSGDEFAVLLTQPFSPVDSEALAERIVQAAGAPFLVTVDRGDGHPAEDSATLGASVGVAHSGPGEAGPDVSPEALLKCADLAMYAAKSRGRGRFTCFDRHLLAGQDRADRLRERHDLERRLRAAIRAGDLRLHYQPLVDVASGQVTCVEALARWTDGDRGDVPARTFVEVAESSGLIVDLGRWALRQACLEASRWPGRYGHPAPRVAVNVSAVQLAERTFIDDVTGALAASGLPPDRLCLEITETAAVDDLHETARHLAQLRALGVQLALDDFGTGFSSLTMLRTLPVSSVKIDKSFIDGVPADSGAVVLVRLLIDTAHTLGLTVCAEGVEHREQARQLTSMGCDVLQGWFVGGPQHGADALAALLADAASDALTDAPRSPATSPDTPDELILVVDRDWHITYASAASATVLGRAPAELVGTSAFASLRTDDPAGLRRLGERAPGEVVTTCRVQAADGRHLWLHCLLKPLPGADGEPSEILLVCTDVTLVERRADIRRRARHASPRALVTPSAGLPLRRLPAS